MADYNTLTLPQKITGAMPGVLALYNVPNPPTTLVDATALDNSIVALDTRIAYIKNQATVIGSILGGGYAEALTGTSYNLSTNSPVIQDFIPYIPPGYTVGDITLGTILSVTEGVRDAFQNQSTQLKQGSIIPQDGIPDPETDTTPVVPVPVPITVPETVEVEEEVVIVPPPIVTPPIVQDGEEAPLRVVPNPTPANVTVSDGTQRGENSAFSSLKNSLKGAFLSDVYLRDYTHAAKTFIPNKFSNAPKVKFLFHTYFNINANAWTPPQGIGLSNYGVLVKSVKLPAFRFETDTLNQYNRKRIVQSKIKYEPIDIVFHDDNASQIAAMWNAYYRYYYADSWNPELNGKDKTYNRRNIYDPSLSDDMQYGFRGDSFAGQNERPNFFNDITVYGLWANNYIAYTFINPIITNFSHDTYEYADGASTMSNNMTIDYETVTYNTGVFDLEGENPVTGFGADAHYDYTDSPNEKLGIGGGPAEGIAALMAILNDPNASAFEKAQALAKLSQLDPSALISSVKNAVIDGAKDAIKNAVLNKLTGGLFGNGESAGVPTNGTSGGMVNISNQGGVTGANNSNTSSSSSTAGSQNFGQSLVSNIGRNLGIGG